MMLIARWQIDACFGQKQKVVEMLGAWACDIAPQAGLLKSRLLTGSTGALEATVEHEWEVADLDELDRAWSKLATIDAHQTWSRDLAPFVVSGTARWTVYRVLPLPAAA